MKASFGGVFVKLRRLGWLLAGIGLLDVVLIVEILCVVLCPMDRVKTGAAGEAAEPKFVALTFDDGPNREYTEMLLDGLKERGVKASFFLLGECLDGNEEVVKRMAEEGHLIGVHGMEHKDLTREPLSDALSQLGKAKKQMEEIAGTSVEYVRPPYGSWNETLQNAVGENLKLRSVFWDVDSLDWELQDTWKIVQKVERDVENGDIILMHDEFSTSVEAALRIIDNLMAKGYTFVTANELVVD